MEDSVNRAFVKHIIRGIHYWTVPSFNETGLVVHGFSGRLGGVSQGAYESLNLSIHTDDKPENILKNRQLIANVLGFNPEDIVCAQQVHGNHVYGVLPEDKGRGAKDRITVIPGTDALMTDEPGIVLMAFFADCVPIFFLDPKQKIIALAHAGWQGTALQITFETIKAMEKKYKSCANELLVAVGPSIGPCHYQVDTPVIDRMKEAYKEKYLDFFENLYNGYGQLNLWEANRYQAQEAGVPNQNITLARICTFCEQGEFFSHRAKMAGRQAAMIMLKG